MDVCFGGFDEILERFAVAARGILYIMATGASRSKMRSMGVSAYRVVARRIAPTFSRKSTAHDNSPYGLKKNCRDCNADQRMTATLFNVREQIKKLGWGAYGRDSCH